MSKKKQKTKDAKITKKHDFSHLLKTKTTAKAVESEIEISKDIVSPQNDEVKRDMKLAITIILVFTLVIFILWFFAGKNNETFKFYDKIKFF